MKMTKKVLSVLLAVAVFLAGFGVSVFAEIVGQNVYYIDSIDGDDSNSGLSEDEAVKTIAGLKIGEITAGTTFLFRNGGRYECAVDMVVENNLDWIHWGMKEEYFDGNGKKLFEKNVFLSDVFFNRISIESIGILFWIKAYNKY